jgi:tetratricopeptide (TPR) repeat protein
MKVISKVRRNNMTLEARTPLSTRRKATPPNDRAGGAGSMNRGPGNHGITHQDAATLQHYQAALQLLQQSKFEKALVAFEKLLGTAPAPLAERCRMYVCACHRELTKSKLEFATPEEQYDYAVSMLNMDYYEEAREQFAEILKRHPEADYALYGLAVLDAITGQVEECLEHLSLAIGGNPRNRLQARTDTDFQSMQDDPRFTELLYPEAP